MTTNIYKNSSRNSLLGNCTSAQGLENIVFEIIHSCPFENSGFKNKAIFKLLILHNET